MSGIVYFFTSVAPDPDTGECIEVVKIGYTSKSPYRRLADISTGSPAPVEFIGYLPGGRDLEWKLHQRFSKYRLRGEWFRNDGPVFLTFLDACEHEGRHPL